MSVPVPIVKVRPRVTPTELQFWWSPPAQVWVAGGNGENQMAYSTNGTEWLASTSGNNIITSVCRAVAYGDDMWVAGGDGTNVLAYSTNGIDWTDSSGGNNIFTTSCYAVAYGNGVWVAGGAGTNQLAYSSDAIEWTASTSGNTAFTGQCFVVAYGNGLWVAGGYGENQMAYSSDGMDWTGSTSGTSIFTTYCQAIAYGNGMWVAGGQGTNQLAYSTDGINWDYSSSGNSVFTTGCYAVAYGNGMWVAGGQGTNQLAYSTNGMDWTASSSGNSLITDYCFAVSYQNSIWVAGGASENRLVYSTDGMNWTASASGNNIFTFECLAIANKYTPITGYVLESSSPALSYTLDQAIKTKIVTGLTNLTDYSFTLKTDISGSYSATVPFRTVRTSEKPQPVTTLTNTQTIVDGLLNLTANWTDPEDYAYYYVYALKIATGAKNTIYRGTREYTTLTQSFTGLDPARSYTFTIQRGNDAGYSTPVSFTTTSVFFDPKTIPGLQFWGDAADVSGNGDTVPDGSAVGVWKDKSIHANDASGVFVPATLQTDSVGRYLSFDTTNGYSLTQSSWAYNDYFTIFIVEKPTDYSYEYTLVGKSSGTDNFNITYENSSSVLTLSTSSSFANTNSYQNILDEQAYVWCFTNYGGPSIYLNKIIVGTNPSQYNFQIYDSLLTIGYYDGVNNYNGRMREILMYKGVMTEDNRESITNYLYDKWMQKPALIPLVPVQNSTILWLDAKDPNTFFQDASGTIPITGDGSPVTLWKDKSGYGNDMFSGITIQYTTSGVNGRPSLDTEGGKGGQTSTNNYIQSGDTTLFLVAQMHSNSDTGHGYFTHDSNGYFGFNSKDEFGNVIWRQSATRNNNDFIDTGIPFLFYGTMKKEQLMTGTFIDASGAQTSYTIETPTMAAGIHPIYLNDFDGVYYAEIIYYNRALTDAEIQKNTAYLSQKWGIPIPPAQPFSPLEPALKLWLDSSDPATVITSGSVLTAWNDKSGNNKNATAYGGPTVSNGIVFDGSGQWLSLPNGSLPAGNYSYYIATNVTGDSAIISAGSANISGKILVAACHPSPYTFIVSIDGVNWIPANNDPFPGNGAYAVESNGSYWVAVGNDSDGTITVAKSFDGFNWFDSVAGGGNNPASGGYGITVAWGDSYWLGSFTTGIFSSTDGVNWTAGTNDLISCNGLAWNGTYWVGVGEDGSNTICIVTSPDGSTWTDSSGGSGNNPFTGGIGNGIAWSGSYWVAVGYNGPQTVCIAKSTDGLNWTPSTNNPFLGASGIKVAWNGSYFIAIGVNGDSSINIAKSSDGMDWTAVETNVLANNPRSIVWNGYYWVALSDTIIAKSFSGLYWTSSPNTYSNGRAVASGNALPHNSFMNITTATSTESSMFAQTTFNTTIGGGTGMWVAGGYGTNELIYSMDGISWTPAVNSNIFTGSCYAVAYGNGLWVATGYGVNYFVYSMNGIVWTPSASGNGVITGEGYTVAYGNGMWVAGGHGTNLLAYSTNGIDWTGSSSGNSMFYDYCYEVAYGNGMWVAAGGYGYGGEYGTGVLAYSTNGIDWTLATSANSLVYGYCWTVAYGNGMWVAGGDGNYLIYSTNGIDWYASSNGDSIFDGACKAVAYGNGMWVAGGYGINQLAYSTNGIDWTASASGNSVITGECKSVAYWNGRWVAGGYGTNQVAYSTNGIDWTLSASGNALITGECLAVANSTTGQINYVVSQSGAWVAGGYGTNTLVYSTNGIDWIPSTDPSIFTSNSYAVAYGNGLWVATGVGVNYVVYSTNGIDWTPSASGNSVITGEGYTVAYGNGMWVAGGHGTNQLAYSTNGIDWTGSGNPFLYYCYGVAYGNGIWVAVGGYGYAGSYVTILYSTNGIDWNISGSSYNIMYGYGYAVAYGNGMWVAGGDTYGNSLAYSTNGIDWTGSNNGNSIITSACRAVAYGNGMWVAGGYGTNQLAYSTNGIDWTGSASGNSVIDSGCYTVAYSNGRWVAGGDGTNRLAYSTDGINWTASPSGNSVLTTACYAAANNNIGQYGQGTLTDFNPISPTSTVIIESIYDGNRNLFLSGRVGAADTVKRLQDSKNNFIGRDLSGNYMNGTIKEILVYNTAHTTQRRKQVENYLKEKWIKGNYAPSDMSLWLDASGSSNFDLSGNRIRAWIDKSTYGTDMSQNIIWAQPRYSLDSISNRYGVQFGAEGFATGLLNSNQSPFGNTSSWSMFMVQRYDFSSSEGSDTGGTTGIVCTAYEISGNDPTYLYSGTTTVAFSDRNIIELFLLADGSSLTPTVEVHKRPVITSQVVNDLSYYAYYNGYLAGSYGLGTPMTTAAKLNIGFSGALNPNIPGAMRGYIYEIIAYNRVVEDEERQAIEGYLAWKWNTEDLLVPTHPYYIAPPEAPPP